MKPETMVQVIQLMKRRNRNNDLPRLTGAVRLLAEVAYSQGDAIVQNGADNAAQASERRRKSRTRSPQHERSDTMAHPLMGVTDDLEAPSYESDETSSQLTVEQEEEDIAKVLR